MDIRIVKGNIIDAKVDAIVLPANTKLKEGKGASQAIFKAAGRKALTKVCKEIGYCEMGSAVPTAGFNLGCKTIIHAVVPKWIDGKHNEYSLLGSAYVSALELADVMECRSIAFPLLASGNNGFDLELAFQIAIQAIKSFEPDCLKDVILVLFGNQVTEQVKKKGYTVSILPRDLARDLELQKNSEKNESLIQKGVDYFKDPRNRERALKLGKDVAGFAMMVAKFIR